MFPPVAEIPGSRGDGLNTNHQQDVQPVLAPQYIQGMLIHLCHQLSGLHKFLWIRNLEVCQLFSVTANLNDSCLFTLERAPRCSSNTFQKQLSIQKKWKCMEMHGNIMKYPIHSPYFRRPKPCCVGKDPPSPPTALARNRSASRCCSSPAVTSAAAAAPPHRNRWRFQWLRRWTWEMGRGDHDWGQVLWIFMDSLLTLLKMRMNSWMNSWILEYPLTSTASMQLILLHEMIWNY